MFAIRSVVGVSIKGSSQAWFDRAVEGQGPAGIVWPAALDLGRPLTLHEALAVVLILGAITMRALSA